MTGLKFRGLASELKSLGVRGLLLDLDGCFIPVGSWVHMEIAIAAFSKLGHRVSFDQAERVYKDPLRHGIDWYLLMAACAGQKLSAADFAAFRAAVVAATPEVIEQHSGRAVSCNPGAADFLRVAAEEFGDKLTIVTATPQSVAEVLLLQSGLAAHCNRIYGCDRFWRDGQVLDKTERVLWSEAAAEIGLTLDQTAVVEDGRLGATFALASPEVRAFIGLSEKLAPLAAQFQRSNVWLCDKTGDWTSLQRVS